jgi:hypothetical protein
MASSWGSRLPLAVVLLLVACFSSTAAATSYTVGDGSGWTTGVDYTSWAASKNFKVGDNLGTYMRAVVLLHACACIRRHVVTHAFWFRPLAHAIEFNLFVRYVGRSVQLRERAAHGGGGERGRVHGVHGRQPAGLRQQRRDHRGPQDARHPLLRVQHHGALRRRDEAGGDRRRLQLPCCHAADVVPDLDHALHDAGHHHAVHDADVLWRRRHHGDPGHDSVHVIPQRGRPWVGGVGWI